MPPLDADDLAELLDLYALPARAASKLHADSGGNPYLALALGGAFADRTSVAWRPPPLPQRIHALLRDRIGALPAEVRETLLIAALATRADGRAAAAGRPGRGRARHPAGRGGRPAGHRRQRGPVHPAGGRDRRRPSRRPPPTGPPSTPHCPLWSPTRSSGPGTGRSPRPTRTPRWPGRSSTAAEDARRRGARGLAAELYLLAADRTPPELDAERLEWLVAAAEVGVGRRAGPRS